MGQLLLPLVVAVQVCLVIAGTGGAAQTVAVAVCLHHIAEAAPVLGDSPAVLGAEATHRRQILQWSIRPEGIYQAANLIGSFRSGQAYHGPEFHAVSYTHLVSGQLR